MKQNARPTPNRPGADEWRRCLADAEATLAAKQYEKAVQQFAEAREIEPANIEVLTGLIKAEQLLNLQTANARRQNDARVKLEIFQRLLRNGKANFSDRRYEAAAFALGEALKFVPDDEDARSALAEANSKLATDAKSQAERQNRAAKYQALMSDGRRSMAARQYDRAAKAFHDVQSLMKGDKAAEEFARERFDSRPRRKTKKSKIVPT